MNELEGSRFKPTLRARPGLGTLPRYEATGDLRVEKLTKRSDEYRVSETAPKIGEKLGIHKMLTKHRSL